MRPLPSSENYPSATRPRSRKSSVGHIATTSSHVPTAFVMRREEELEQPYAASRSSEAAGKSRNGASSVQSLANTLEAAFGQNHSMAKTRAGNDNCIEGSGKAASRSPSPGTSSGPVNSSESLKAPLARKLKTKPCMHAALIPLAVPKSGSPSSTPPSAMPSTPTSVSLHSLKSSDEESALDEATSRTIASSSDEEEDGHVQKGIIDSFPQLVMPRIQMPTRRPFTTRGRNMGKLKVMVAGSTGVGKSSLIRSILQLCEHIVHIDPVSPSQSSTLTDSKMHHQGNKLSGTDRITEINASTKPCPHWWTDEEEKRRSRRKSGSNDAILERNICFVDTPGFSKLSSGADEMDLVIDYLESLFCQTSSMHTLEDKEILGLVSGKGGVSVDVVFYLLPPDQDISRDIEFMRRLSILTNVMPIIARSDTLSAQDVIASKVATLARLQAASIKPFLFGEALDDALLAAQSLSPATTMPVSNESPGKPTTLADCPPATPTYPYAVSSVPRPDNEVMDASLLMSSGYMQPLLPSELNTLVNQVFNPDSIAWLRHSAARKYLTWRRETSLPGDSFITHSIRHRHATRPGSSRLSGTGLEASVASSVFTPSSPSHVLVSRSVSPFSHSNIEPHLLDSPFSLDNSPAFESFTDLSVARPRHYAQGEQHLTEVRISEWATDLQRGLRVERERFEELQRNDRAKWLLKRVNEEVSRGAIVTSPGGSPRAGWAVVRHGNERPKKAKHRVKRVACLDPRDPLGLCDLSDELKKRGLVLAKFLGGMSVLGAIVIGSVRACGMETGLPQNGWWGLVRDWLTGSTA